MVSGTFGPGTLKLMKHILSRLKPKSVVVMCLRRMKLCKRLASERGRNITSRINPDDLKFMLHEAGRMLGKPYLLGSKWKLNDPNPSGPIDCSGFVRWVFSRGGISIPDGSYNEILALHKEVGEPFPGDLGFFKSPTTGIVDHVGMLYDPFCVIEARGVPYNEVIIRPRSKWEAYESFTGWYTYTG